MIAAFIAEVDFVVFVKIREFVDKIGYFHIRTPYLNVVSRYDVANPPIIDIIQRPALKNGQLRKVIRHTMPRRIKIKLANAKDCTNIKAPWFKYALNIIHGDLEVK